MTGGEPVSARYLYGEFFEFHPQFKLVLATNHKPEIRGTDEAIWRRIHLVPFGVTIPKPEQDKRLLDKLKAEAAGILVWALEGCMEWQTDGLMPPQAITEATKTYRIAITAVSVAVDAEHSGRQRAAFCTIAHRNPPHTTLRTARRVYRDLNALAHHADAAAG